MLVGPNNTGKSRTLVELQQWLSLEHYVEPPANAFFVLDEPGVEQLLDGSQTRDWLLERRYSWVNDHDHVARFRTINSGEQTVESVAHSWPPAERSSRLGSLGSHLVRGLWCGERLQHLGAPNRLDHDGHPDHPVHWLVRDKALLQAFDSAIWTAFGMHVIVDAWGTSILLRVSRNQTQSDFVGTSEDGLPDADLVRRLRQLPTLESQSDGVRSFAGMVLTLLTAQFPTVLLDEPEAFLHPPQARLLGRSLAEFQRDGQLLVATHSLDVLLGLVESRPEKVLIVRLTRDGERTSCRTLPPDQLAGLWRDPLLRFSRALDGLFHDGVVVCEGDTDSQFYSAIAARADPDATPTPGRHVMFTYAGSKHRIPLIVRALRALDVPVRAAVDFDILSSESELRTLVEATGSGMTGEMSSDLKLVNSHIRGGAVAPKVGPVADAIEEALSGSRGRELDASDVRGIRQIIEPPTGWRDAKRRGLAAVPPAEATVAAKRLLATLRAAGIFVVPSGEVESFVPEVGGKGPRWVVQVVEEGHLDAADEATKFVGEILASIPNGRSEIDHEQPSR